MPRPRRWRFVLSPFAKQVDFLWRLVELDSGVFFWLCFWWSNMGRTIISAWPLYSHISACINLVVYCSTDAEMRLIHSRTSSRGVQFVYGEKATVYNYMNSALILWTWWLKAYNVWDSISDNANGMRSDSLCLKGKRELQLSHSEPLSILDHSTYTWIAGYQPYRLVSVGW